MITLYGFGPNFGMPDASAFVLKVDCYLRAVGIDFETVGGFDNMKRAPKGKLPYITDGEKTIADSAFIIDYLKETYGDTLDQDLTAEQKSIAHVIGKTLDENLYFCVVWSRWVDELGWPTAKKEFFDAMPVPIKYILPTIAQRGVKKALHEQGIGRHSRDEILAIAKKDLDAMSELLGTKSYFLLNKVTTLDVTAYGHLAQLILADMDSDFNDQARSYPNLVDFCNRMKAQYYPED
jgi:glutathione S-transferase